MTISRKQDSFLRSKHKRINLLSGSVRSGKTHILNTYIPFLAFHGPPGKGAIVAKTLETLRENILDPLKERFSGISYSDNGRRIFIEGCNRKIRGVGANDEQSKNKIHGDTLAWAVGDEVVIWPESFFKMLMTRLSAPGAQFFGSCNPGSPLHWLKKDYIDRRGDGQGKINLAYYTFLLTDNPSNTAEYMRDLRTEFSGLFYQRFIEGLWVLADGIIYDMFEEEKHVYKEKPPEYRKYVVGGDFGMTNPTCFGLFGYDDPKDVMMVREYYHQNKPRTRQMTPSEYADALVVWLGGIYPEAIYLDPSASALIEEVSRRKIDGKYLIVRKANNSVLDGINFVCNSLNNEELRIHESCTETIREFSAYSWDKRAQLKGEDKPMKVDDHCMDLVRYQALTHFGGNQSIIYHPGAEAKEKTYAERLEESFEEVGSWG